MKPKKQKDKDMEFARTNFKKVIENRYKSKESEYQFKNSLIKIVTFLHEDIKSINFQITILLICNLILSLLFMWSILK